MARIRTTKPEFWTSEQITECSVNARLMFLGMWNFCDDEGRHVASTKRLKMEVYPGDGFTDKQIRTWMNELIAQGLVLEYDVNPDDDKSQVVSYWQVTGWHHQKISHPQESKIPGPFHERSVNVHGAFTPEGNGREGKGMEWNGMDKKPPLSPKGERLKIPEELEPYRDHVELWLKFKREKGQAYKTTGLNALFKRMQKMGDGLPTAVEWSMESNYAGLFPPPSNGSFSSGKPKKKEWIPGNI